MVTSNKSKVTMQIWVTLKSYNKKIHLQSQDFLFYDKHSRVKPPLRMNPKGIYLMGYLHTTFF